VGITRFSGTGGSGFDEAFGFKVPLETWVQLVFVGTAQNTRLYVNGKPQTTLHKTIHLPLAWLGSTQGYEELASTLLRDVRVFDQALSDAQVEELMHGPTPTLRWAQAWGRNTEGQLLDGSIVNRLTPTRVPYLGKVVTQAFAVGATQSFALLDDGTVWGWGQNNWGQVGDGTTSNRSEPVEVPHLRRFAANAIAGGGYHNLALLADGSVLAWGRNDYSQLGTGTAPNAHPIPVVVPNLRGVKAIAAGSLHSMALLEDGSVWAWGANANGQLGDGTTIARNQPVKVSLSGVKAIAAGGLHSMALLEDGSVWAWGYNGYGQLGDGTNTSRSQPVEVQNVKNVTAIDASHYIESGPDFSMALLADGTVWTWGYNGYGQLGDNTNVTNNKPTKVVNIGGVQAIAAGGRHALALVKDGLVWSWGANDAGQLGDGTNTNRNEPGSVSGVSGAKIIAAGLQHSFVLG
jgi:alpha-tubulin suppressor-like RCC1 family protein